MWGKAPFLFPSISFFFPRSRILPRGEAKLFAWSFCLPLTNGWCDCGAFEWAKRQELYLEIPFSTSSLRFLGRYAESLLAPVCVLKERKAASVRRFPLGSVGSQNLPLLFDFLVYIQKLYWHDMFITDGIVKAWRPNLPKAYTRWHKPCRYERLQGWEHATDEVLIGASKCKGPTLDPTEMFRVC